MFPHSQLGVSTRSAISTFFDMESHTSPVPSSNIDGQGKAAPDRRTRLWLTLDVEARCICKTQRKMSRRYYDERRLTPFYPQTYSQLDPVLIDL